MMKRVGLFLAVLLLVPGAQAIELTPHYPQAGQTVYTGTPTLIVNYTGGALDASQVQFEIDGIVQEEEPSVTDSNITHIVQEFLKLAEGNHTIRVTAGDAELEVAFVVNYTVPPKPAEPLDTRLIVIVSAVGIGLLAAAGGGLYVWGRKVHRFTFRKHFLRHPQQVKFLTLYVPAGVAVCASLATAYFMATTQNPPRYGLEYVAVIGAAAALGPFGVSSARSTMRTRAHERAFAQFLFELADAVRGGIDPVKAVQELAKTQDGLLRKPLGRASDMLRLGRSMEEALKAMTAQMGSPLVSRYAALVGEASSMGGSVSGVMQRAAKDMDDLVKIKGERRRALRQPVFTMYMAFGVLLLMILQIVQFAPNIGDLNLGALGGAAAAAPAVPRMGIAAMQSAFFHLLLVNAAGGGLLVGSFTEGRIRDGILHALAMTGVACLIYPLAT